MILKNLRLNNFKQYPELDLSFKEGLIGIVGKNGSGKSTIFEAILLCLFGSISLKNEFYRSSWASSKDPVELELEFSVGNEHFKVKRSFRGKALAAKAELYSGDEQLIATQTGAVNEEITKALGMGKDAFTRSIFSGQKELGELTNASGEERKRLVRKMAGLDKLDHIQISIRKDRNDLKNQIKGKSEQLLSEEELKVLKDTHKQTKETNKELQAESQELDKKLKEKQDLYLKSKESFDKEQVKFVSYNKYKNSKTRLQESLQHRNQLLAVKKKLLESLEKLRGDLAKRKASIESYLQQRKELEKLQIAKNNNEKLKSLTALKAGYSKSLTSLKDTLTNLKPAIDKIPEHEKQVATYDLKIDEIEKLLRNKDQEISMLVKKEGALQGKIKDRQSKLKNIESLGKNAECPTCLRPLVDSYEQTISLFRQDLEQYQSVELKELTSNREIVLKQQAEIKKERDETDQLRQSLIKDLAALKSQRERFRKDKDEYLALEAQTKKVEEDITNLGPVKFSEKEFLDLKKSVNAFEPEFIQYRKDEASVAEVPMIQKEIGEITLKIKAEETEQKRLEQQLNELDFSEEAFELIQKQLKEFEASRDESRMLVGAHREKIFKNTEIVNKQKYQIDNQAIIQKDIQASNTELDDLEMLVGLFSSFKTYILGQLRPTISSHASELFNQVTKGKYENIKVDENFDFHIMDDGSFYPIDRFSGGEIDLANLCLRIAISKTITEISGSDAALNFLGFDEIFGSQDEERRNEILRALDLLKEQYRQIYIISHIESVKENFPKILEVSLTKDGSVATWLH